MNWRGLEIKSSNSLKGLSLAIPVLFKAGIPDAQFGSGSLQSFSV